jgi:hypothetical protein
MVERPSGTVPTSGMSIPRQWLCQHSSTAHCTGRRIAHRLVCYLRGWYNFVSDGVVVYFTTALPDHLSQSHLGDIDSLSVAVLT